MIDALRYEPQGQRQRFDPGEQRASSEEHKHIHLHLHLHLSFRRRQGRFWSLSVNRLTTIFAALNVATTLAFLMTLSGWDPPPLSSIAAPLALTGLALAWGAVLLGGLPLLVSIWRRSPRVRFLLVVPFIALLIIAQINPLSSAILGGLGLTPLDPRIGFIVLVFGVYPLISAIVFNRAIRRTEISSSALRFASLLSFVVVGAMVLLLLGGFLYYLSQVPSGALWSTAVRKKIDLLTHELFSAC